MNLMRRRSTLPLFAAVGATVIALASGSTAWSATERHQQWTWQGAAPASGKLEIHGINGGIVAEPGTGNQIEVVADKHGKRHDPAEVEIKVVQDSDGITICAVYPKGGSPCTGNSWNGGHHDCDVQVEFHVKVPAGIAFDANTVNGGITARSLAGPVKAHTVNGECEIETSMSGEAHTVNGGVRATLGRVSANDRLEFETVNGSITVSLPDNASAQLEGATVNGGIRTDFPAEVQGKWGPKSMRATLGKGGARVRLNTVNGSIALKRASL
ncbi:MAG: hypothetical protein U0704_07515 [Candidatus Eisenbacteria bacterium]